MKQRLEEKLASVEQRFNALQAKNKELNEQKDGLDKQILANNEECLKLVGEYRLLQSLIEEDSQHNEPEAELPQQKEKK